VCANRSSFDGGSDELVAALSSCTGLTALQFDQIAITDVFELILTPPRIIASLKQLSFVILRAAPEGEQESTTTVNWRVIFTALRSLTSLSLGHSLRRRGVHPADTAGTTGIPTSFVAAAADPAPKNC
jgi:hypothetical protein